MCPARWPLAALLALLTAAVAYQQEGDGVQQCLEQHSAGRCLEKLTTDLLENAKIPDKLQILPGVSLIRSNSTARGLNDVTNRTMSIDILSMADSLTHTKEARGKKKKQRQQAMMFVILTALIAAKAAAIFTAKSILIPLALKSITLLALKALMIGKIAVVVASAFGFLRLISSGSEHTTEVIYDHSHAQEHKRVDASAPGLPYIPPGYMVRKKEPGSKRKVVVQQQYVPQTQPQPQHVLRQEILRIPMTAHQSDDRIGRRRRR